MKSIRTISSSTLACRPSRAIAVALCVWLAGAVLTGQGALTPTSPRRGGNPEAAKRVNPVPATDASVAAGRRNYQRLCSRCHGVEGRGDGGGAGAGGQPADLTDATWEFGSSDGEIFAVISEGTSADMEGFAERVDASEIWNLINYIRSLRAKP